MFKTGICPISFSGSAAVHERRYCTLTCLRNFNVSLLRFNLQFGLHELVSNDNFLADVIQFVARLDPNRRVSRCRKSLLANDVKGEVCFEGLKQGEHLISVAIVD